MQETFIPDMVQPTEHQETLFKVLHPVAFSYS